MAQTRGDKNTLDLLAWEPKEPEKKFDENKIRAHSLEARVARSISVALDECKYTREEVAERMSAFLEKSVSLAMLNSYASQAREDHNISVVRLMALVHATEDWRLLQVLAGPFPVTLVDRKYLGVIKMAQIREKRKDMEREEKALEQEAKSEGLI